MAACRAQPSRLSLPNAVFPPEHPHPRIILRLRTQPYPLHKLSFLVWPTPCFFLRKGMASHVAAVADVAVAPEVEGDEENQGFPDSPSAAATVVAPKPKKGKAALPLKRDRVDTLRTLDSLPTDLAAAIQAGRVPGWIVERYLELEKNFVFCWLLQFEGFRERLLADDLFLTKVAIESGVGIFTKTAAELERRRERFTKELDFAFADVVMAIIADFMLVWLPAPTFSLRPPLAINAGVISTFFYGCPDNAFEVAMAGTSYSLLQRTGAVVICTRLY